MIVYNYDVVWCVLSLLRKSENGEQKTLEIGNGNVFHIGAHILLNSVLNLHS